ncbi:hypothetical protein ACFLQ6_01270 [Thermoproteota archaeon]
MKLKLALFTLIMLATLTATIIPTMGKPNSCTTLRDGTLVDKNGNPLTMGYDAWGYNYQSHMFNGWYHNAGRPAIPWTEETLKAAGKSTTWLVMKWSDEWLSNKDCNGDGLLDRGYSSNPENPISSASPGAWETNHQLGSYEDEETGKTCKWQYFVKIVYVNPDNAYKAVDPEDGVEYWYTNDDGEKIGSVIWGAYARILQIYNDPSAGDHGVENKWEEPTGFGYYK